MQPKTKKAPKKKRHPPTLAPARAAAQPAAYPWDSYQDAIVVHSVEDLRNSSKRRVGLEHYRHMLDQTNTYEKICVHPDDEWRDEPSERDFLEPTDENKSLRDSLRSPSIDYTCLPSPPVARSAYQNCIYVAETRNPAVFLAIIRIAQKNCPFLDFNSAINHLPNIGPADPFPALARGIFVDDVRWQNADGDSTLTIALFPHLYNDKRHALGFYAVGKDVFKDPNRTWVRTAVFTPCTTEDLEEWDMLEGSDNDQGEKTQAVGVRQGKWLNVQVVEDYDKWCYQYRVLSIWQKRMQLTTGIGEDGMKWKT